MYRFFLAMAMFAVVIGSVYCSPQAEVGVGVELVGEVPFLTVNGNWGSIGGEAGIGMGSYSLLGTNFSMFWYCVNGKYYVPLPALESALHPYLGGGIIGATASSSATYLDTEFTFSASATGGLALGGLEYSLASQGLPLVIFGGVNYVSINKVEISVGGTTVELPAGMSEIPINISGLGMHLGIQWVF